MFARRSISRSSFFFFSLANSQYSECSNIWLDYYVCIHVPGATTTSAAPTPTDDGKLPTQSGIAANCDKFHKVSSGDQCDSIETEFASPRRAAAANISRLRPGARLRPSSTPRIRRT